MSRIEVHDPMIQERRTTTTARTAAMGGSALVAIGGICVAGLAIAALVNAIPGALGAIAVIVFGIILVLQGGSLTARFMDMAEPGGLTNIEAPAGLGAGLAGGIAGIVLGILSLLGIGQVVLMAVAVIVFGVCLWLSSAVLARFNTLVTVEPGLSVAAQRTMSTVSLWASGMNTLVGLAAVILGIVALGSMTSDWVTSLTLSLVALLCLGCSVIVSGAATSTKIMSYCYRR